MMHGRFGAVPRRDGRSQRSGPFADARIVDRFIKTVGQYVGSQQRCGQPTRAHTKPFDTVRPIELIEKMRHEQLWNTGRGSGCGRPRTAVMNDRSDAGEYRAVRRRTQISKTDRVREAYGLGESRSGAAKR